MAPRDSFLSPLKYEQYDLRKERKYGRPDLDDFATRKELFKLTLKRVFAHGVDIDEIIRILEEAKTSHMHNIRLPRMMEYEREYRTEYIVIKRNMVKWLKEASRFYKRGGRFFSISSRELESLLSRLEKHPHLSDEDARLPQLRLPKAGNRRRPWLDKAGDQLSQAGVTAEEDREELLSLIGVKRKQKAKSSARAASAS